MAQKSGNRSRAAEAILASIVSCGPTNGGVALVPFRLSGTPRVATIGNPRRYTKNRAISGVGALPRQGATRVC